MKARIRMRSLAVMVFAVMAMGAFAQSDVRVSKVLRAQKMGKQTVLRSTDSRLPQDVVRFDREEDVTNMPQELRDFLSSYEEALRRMDEGAEASQVLSVDPYASYQTIEVGPLLGDIEYDQGTPYNDKCPIINNARAITGCVATAMAEIMRYWKYPAVGKGSTTYTGSKGAQTYNFADHPFDWNNMLPTYKRDYTPAQASAVSELMLACGASVNMNYAYDGSGANSEKVLPALRDFFGYDPAIEFLSDATEDVISTIWVEALKKEFDAGRPVYYSGANQTAGHAFVMDGYKIDGSDVYFHVNWGWNGSYNGWYLITYLRPEDTNYSAYRNTMVFRIFPPGMGIENTEEQTATKLDMNAPVYTILGNKIPASSMQRGMIYIQNGRKFVW